MSASLRPPHSSHRGDQSGCKKAHKFLSSLWPEGEGLLASQSGSKSTESSEAYLRMSAGLRPLLKSHRSDQSGCKNMPRFLSRLAAAFGSREGEGGQGAPYNWINVPVEQRDKSERQRKATNVR